MAGSIRENNIVVTSTSPTSTTSSRPDRPYVPPFSLKLALVQCETDPLPSPSCRAQEATALSGTMAACQKEIDTYLNVTELPINLGGCGQIMDAVTKPFTQE